MEGKLLNLPQGRAEQISIREASAGDRSALLRLAALDSQPMLRGHVLVAELDGEIEAAVSVPSGRSVADPFRYTGGLVALLETRAEQLRGSAKNTRRHLPAATALRFRAA